MKAKRVSACPIIPTSTALGRLGRHEQGVIFVLRLLNRRFGDISDDLQEKIKFYL
jgi:Domain of unknown function (DUF4351)